MPAGFDDLARHRLFAGDALAKASHLTSVRSNSRCSSCLTPLYRVTRHAKFSQIPRAGEEIVSVVQQEIDVRMVEIRGRYSLWSQIVPLRSDLAPGQPFSWAEAGPDGGFARVNGTMAMIEVW